MEKPSSPAPLVRTLLVDTSVVSYILENHSLRATIESGSKDDLLSVSL